MNKEDLYRSMRKAIVEGDKPAARQMALEAVRQGLDLNEVIDKGYVPGIQEVGDLWGKGEYFLPELISSAEAMKAAMAVLEPEALPEAVCYSTHRLPLRTLLRLWEERGSKAFVLGIQPKEVIFKEGLSPEVKTSVDSLAEFFSQRFCTE